MSLDRSRKNGISSWCKECRRDNIRTWTSKQGKEELKRNNKERYHKRFNSERARDYALYYRYGITQDDYNSLLAKQEFKCKICGRDSREMTYFLHTDHCHTTGKVRGLLCSPCNVYLGYIKDNKQCLESAITYLGESD